MTLMAFLMNIQASITNQEKISEKLELTLKFMDSPLATIWFCQSLMPDVKLLIFLMAPMKPLISWANQEKILEKKESMKKFMDLLPATTWSYLFLMLGVIPLTIPTVCKLILLNLQALLESAS